MAENIQPFAAAPALSVDGLTARLGGSQVLHGVTFSAAEHAITGLIGPNGAGKTTAFNAISGLIRGCGGSVSVFNQRVLGKEPHQIARDGMVRTFQLARELGGLTVLENLMLAPHQLGEKLSGLFFYARKSWNMEGVVYRKALDILKIIELEGHADTRASMLSGGQKKLLELGRALMAEPRLILLDEPGAGVNPALMDKLCNTITGINRERGISFLIVEHDMALIRRLCSHVVFLAQGRTLVQGSFDEVVSDQRVVEAYLGGAAA